MTTPVIHLTSRTELSLPGSPRALCGVYVSDRSCATSRVNAATCPDCTSNLYRL